MSKNQFHDDAESTNDSIFGMTADDVQTPVVQSYSDPDNYSPSLSNKNVKNGTYSAFGRFVPNPFGKTHKIMKYVYYLPTPDGQSSFYVDCPSTIPGHKMIKSNIITQAFFELKDHESKVMRDVSKSFSRKQFYFSLFYILQDDQDVDSVGKIKIWRFGSQVNNMIEREAESVTPTKRPKKSVIVHDPFNGKNFNLYIDKRKNDKGNDITSYEGCTFETETTSFMYDEAGTKFLENTPASKQEFIKFLKDNAPDLSKAAFREWDEDMINKINESVRAAIGDDALFDKIYKKAYGSRYAGMTSSDSSDSEPRRSRPASRQEPAERSVPTTPIPDDAGDDMDFGDTAPKTATAKKVSKPVEEEEKPKTRPAPAPKPPVEEAEEDDFDADDFDSDGDDD